MPEQTMPYGSGKPVWARNDIEEGGGGHSGLNQRRNNTSGNSNGSYQRGGDGTYQYQPPQLTGAKYAEQQTEVLEDTMRTHVQAETTANTVLATLHAQRQQLQNANEDTWAMRTNAALAQREMKELQQKAWLKKRRLYGIIGLLAFVDLMLFVRIVQCGGSFFCRRY